MTSPPALRNSSRRRAVSIGRVFTPGNTTVRQRSAPFASTPASTFACSSDSVSTIMKERFAEKRARPAVLTKLAVRMAEIPPAPRSWGSKPTFSASAG